ncbi:glutamate ABC transporter substrate-binding protein [Streptomyces sp. PSRA5]|uniref:glutamate ABC transporter substrate-binding protein n=1 Tax=Streptomyces panacea TaxID=3035064 RepID=UPI00339CC8F5
MKAATDTNDSRDPYGPPGTGGRSPGRRTGVTVAAVVALTATLTLLPLSRDDRADDVREPRKVAAEVAPADAEAADCVEPERSLRPSPQLDEGPSIDKIKARGHLIVGIDQSSYRWGYRNPATKTIQGFDIDLARAVAKNILGSPQDIVFRAIPTNQRVDALNTTTDSGVDLVVRTMTINCARSEQVAFSTAYFQAGQQVLAPKDSDITGYDESLSGKRVCSADSTTAYDELAKNSFGAIFEDEHDGTPRDEDKLTVPNQLDCLVRLQLGEVDAIVTDNALAAGQAAQDPAVKLVGKPFTEEYYGIAAKLGNNDLVRRVNHVLEEYRAGGGDSLWMKSYRQWLEAGLPDIKAPPEAKYKD